MVTIETLLKILRREAYTVEPQKIEGNIYKEIRGKLREIKDRIIYTENKTERKLLKRKAEILREIACELLIIRTQKTLLKKGKGETLEEERKLIQIIEKMLFEGKKPVNQFLMDLKPGKILVRVLDEIPQFVAPEDLKIYGPMKKWDLLFTDRKNIIPLIKGKKIELIGEKR